MVLSGGKALPWPTTISLGDENDLDVIQGALIRATLIKHYKKHGFKMLKLIELDSDAIWGGVPSILYYEARAVKKKYRFVPQFDKPIIDISRNIFLTLRYDNEDINDKPWIDIVTIKRYIYVYVKDM